MVLVIKIVSKKYLGVKLMFDTSIELSTVNSIRNERFFYLTQLIDSLDLNELDANQEFKMLKIA